MLGRFHIAPRQGLLAHEGQINRTNPCGMPHRKNVSGGGRVEKSNARSLLLDRGELGHCEMIRVATTGGRLAQPDLIEIGPARRQTAVALGGPLDGKITAGAPIQAALVLLQPSKKPARHSIMG
jgi:hypothetical protein